MKIRGRTVMTPVPKSDWNQADPKKADYIKNKPTELEVVRGYSAYQVAVMNGFEGTEEEWLRSLHGSVGPQGEAGPAGPAGPAGAAGATPRKGVDYYTEAEKAEMVSDIVDDLPPILFGNLTNIDFSGFDGGSYSEVVDGETVDHSVEFDDHGRPVSVDGTQIEWGDVGVEPEEPADPSAAVESTEYPGCYYRDADGETEWVNPPMIPGEFYRTQERHNGNPVYMACIQHKKATGSNSTTMVYQGKLMLMAYPHIISLSGVVSNSYGEAYPSYKYGDLKTWYDEGELCVDYNVTMAMPESTVDIIVKYTLD